MSPAEDPSPFPGHLEGRGVKRGDIRDRRALVRRRNRLSSADLNPPRFGFLGPGQIQRQNSVLQLRGNLLLIDLVVQLELPEEIREIILAVKKITGCGMSGSAPNRQ